MMTVWKSHSHSWQAFRALPVPKWPLNPNHGSWDEHLDRFFRLNDWYDLSRVSWNAYIPLRMSKMLRFARKPGLPRSLWVSVYARDPQEQHRWCTRVKLNHLRIITPWSGMSGRFSWIPLKLANQDLCAKMGGSESHTQTTAPEPLGHSKSATSCSHLCQAMSYCVYLPAVSWYHTLLQTISHFYPKVSLKWEFGH